MKLGFIGAGKVGTSLSLYLQSKGGHIAGFASKSKASAQFSASLLNCAAFDSPYELAKACDCVFITTPDDAIVQVADALAPLDWSGKTVCHMSGALSSAILSPLKEKGANIFSVHPPYSFAQIITDTKVLDSLTFTAEGEGENHILNQFFPNIIYIQPEQKPLYHLAMCMISNYLVTLMENANEVLNSIQLNLTDFMPLLLGSIENIKTKGTKDALTGPITRGDIGTVRLHLAHLEGVTKDFYRQMGIFTANFAYDAHKIDQATYKKLQEVLTDE